MYAIAGVTGHVGSVAAETLLAQGRPVRVIVRDAKKGEPWKEKGASVAVASFDDEDALTRALSDVAGAFVLLPPTQILKSETPLEDNAKLTTTIAAATRAAKLAHIVLLSSIAAQHPSGTGPIVALHRAERELAGTGAALTAVRAAYFHENWAASLGALASGILPTFVPKTFRFAQVATKDIGRTVAGALVEGLRPGTTQVIELAGPRDYTAEDVASELTRITGKPITAQDTPLDAVVPTITSFGISNAVARLYRDLYEGIATGHIAADPSNQLVRGSVEIGETLASLMAA